MRTWLTVLIVVVLAFALYWAVKGFEDGDGGTSVFCEDITHELPGGPQGSPEGWWITGYMTPDIRVNEQGDWHLWWTYPGGGSGTRIFHSLDALEDAIDDIYMTQEAKDEAHHIVDCIRADCPDCRTI